MAKVMETQSRKSSSLCELPPSCSEALLVLCGVNMAVLTGGEDVMLQLCSVEPLGAFPKPHDDFVSFVIHRNQSLSGICLARADQDCPIEKVNITPLQPFDFTPAHGCAECNGHCSLSALPFFILSRSTQEPKLFVVGERPSNRARLFQRTDVSAEQMPAPCPLQDASNDPYFHVDDCRADAAFTSPFPESQNI